MVNDKQYMFFVDNYNQYCRKVIDNIVDMVKQAKKKIILYNREKTN